jgi:hypothetical protein
MGGLPGLVAMQRKLHSTASTVYIAAHSKGPETMLFFVVHASVFVVSKVIRLCAVCFFWGSFAVLDVLSFGVEGKLVRRRPSISLLTRKSLLVYPQRNFLKASATVMPLETASLTLSSAATSFGIRDKTSSNKSLGMTTTPSSRSQKITSPYFLSARIDSPAMGSSPRTYWGNGNARN